MNPLELKQYLSAIVDKDISLSVMIWGPPGVGKSSVVAQVAAQSNLELVDLRLSQLAPTDLRGLPVPRAEVSEWLPPHFLPRDGEGILFLDEINMATPVMQGVAQQLILDRKIGSYIVPENWHVWAAGNRKEDGGSVFDMPSPLSNRFIHLEVEVDLAAFRRYALQSSLNEKILAFLSFRPELLHSSSSTQTAWPSPRSWEFSSELMSAGLSIEPAVGIGPATEFKAYEAIYQELPELGKILSGKLKPEFPEEASQRYAMVLGLLTRGKGSSELINAFEYLANNAPASTK